MRKTSPKLDAILYQLGRVLVIEDDDFLDPKRKEDYLNRANQVLFTIPKLYSFLLKVALHLFNLLPLFFGFGAKRFTSLSPEDGLAYVTKWVYSRFHIFGEVLKSMRAMIMLVYFSDDKTWPAMGYFPGPHLKEKIALRQKLIQKKQNNPDPKPNSSQETIEV